MAAPPSDPQPNRLAPAPAQTQEVRPRSVRRGDVPEAVLDRYLVERDRQGRPERFYRDHRARDPVFRDHGRSLAAPAAYPDAVADMLRIARHRGWTTVKVQGDEAFRREVWVQARAMDLEVRGYRPTARDRQAAGEREPERPDRRPAALERRMAEIAAVLQAAVADPQMRARLVGRAWARAERTPERPRDRDR
ncbi:MAG: LPD7 domain-containing protein [Brevundimonas sp.]